jgi:hypothetical protein
MNSGPYCIGYKVGSPRAEAKSRGGNQSKNPRTVRISNFPFFMAPPFAGENPLVFPKQPLIRLHAKPRPLLREKIVFFF